ncbi:MAG: hypothetical protein V4549_00765 [Bacteroidota bacterium]
MAKANKGWNFLFIENVALGIEAEILFFLEKIEAESPPLSSFKESGTPK